MSDSLTSEPRSGFVCDCDAQMRDACDGEPSYQTTEGNRYCVLHFPGKEKSAAFEKALQIKLENRDFNFRGVWFPDRLSFSKFDFDADVDFRGAIFNGNADFSDATFRAKAAFTNATFGLGADFNGATFSADADFFNATFSARAFFISATFSSKADFRDATFSEAANFSDAIFSKKASFVYATFSAAADFRGATFRAATAFNSATFSARTHFVDAIFSGDVDFINCTLSGKMDFHNVTFRDYVKFAGNEINPVFSDTSSLSLQFARIEKPDHLSFHALTLRSHWFVNVDARKFEFINVKWRLSTSQEIKDLNLPRDKTIWYSGEYGLGESTHQLLAIAFRHLAVNAEDNHRYQEASRLRYLAMDVRRRERWRGLAFWRLSWWYWLASGYGERVWQASLMLLGILLLSASLYDHVGFARWDSKLTSESDVASAKRDDVGSPLKFSRALTYSAGVMTFQKSEPRPATTAAQAVVLLETILGPVQAALLALAIRRKFMR